jgi:hypothetical protein
MKNLTFGFLIASLGISPLGAQTLTGTVTAADTASALAGATVIAIQQPASPGGQPTVYQAVTNSSGYYAINAPPGQYALCADLPHSLYLDPCQWGSPIGVTVGASAAVLPLTLQKGVRFIVRIHDKMGILSEAVETVTGSGVSAFLSSASVKRFPLPLIYNDANVRDYGTVVPISVPLSVTISGNTLALADNNGASLSTSAMPFQVLPTDIEVIGASSSPAARMFQPPDAKMIHVYTTGLR